MKSSHQPPPKADILIVDDTLDNLRLLSNVLTEQGYNVRGAPNGTSALKAAQLEPPDLILLDIRMPEMDGYEVCQCLKNDERTKGIPVIFLSALNETVNKVKGFEIGGVDYISKPFQTEEVVARVATHLQLVDMQTRLEEQNTQLQREITERKLVEEALRASETELRTLFEAIMDVILVLDGTGRYLKIAPTSPDLFYKPASSAIGKTLHEIFPKPEADRFLAVIRQSLDTQQTVNIEYKLPIRREEVWFEGSVSPMSANTVLVIARDITSRKQMEADLREAKEAAEASNRAKTVFLANMSHELRTPLTSILGFAQMLGRDTTLTDTQHQYVEVVQHNGNHLLTLINDILDFTKIETNRLELHPAEFALPSMLSQLTDVTQTTAELKGISVVYESPDDLPQLVFADQKRLRQILINLLGNAVKFTERGEITFSVAQDFERTSDSHISHLTFKISDTGIGIPSEQLEAIFQPFQQADPYKLQEGSTGLGLAISRRLVKLMGSQLHVTSDEGQGTTFWFELKLPVIETRQHLKSFSLSEDGESFDESIPCLLELLPVDWIVTLMQATEESDIEMLFGIIEQIRERDARLACALASLAENFEYDEILRLLQKADLRIHK